MQYSYCHPSHLPCWLPLPASTHKHAPPVSQLSGQGAKSSPDADRVMSGDFTGNWVESNSCSCRMGNRGNWLALIIQRTLCINLRQFKLLEPEHCEILCCLLTLKFPRAGSCRFLLGGGGNLHGHHYAAESGFVSRIQ